MKLNSEYFTAAFDGPLSDHALVDDIGGKLRELRIEEVDAEDFSALLDWVYVAQHENRDSASILRKLAEVWVLADRFGMAMLKKKCKDFCTSRTIEEYVEWKKVEQSLRIATATKSATLLARCEKLLEKTPSPDWVRCIYLAEKYNMPALLEHTYAHEWPMFPEMDPYFKKLTATSQKRLLHECLRKAVYCYTCRYHAKVGAKRRPLQLQGKKHICAFCGATYTPFLGACFPKDTKERV